MHDQASSSSSNGSKNSKKKATKKQVKKMAVGGDDGFESCDAKSQANVNLCQLLGIDVEKIALDIVMKNRGLL